MRNTLLFAAGLVFLLLAKAKNMLRGYSSPKPFDMSSIDRCVSYDVNVVDQWLHHLERYYGAAPGFLIGKDILELGPGSDLGVGLCLLAKGARSYSACDVHDLALKAPDAFYDALIERIATDEATDEASRLKSDLAAARSGASSRLRYVVRDDFDLAAAFGRDAFDLVVSQAAFEHFEDVDATLGALAKVCRPGAVLIAEIDLKTHSRWIRDKDPNNIYRYPDWLYRIFRFRGSPNRLRPREYAALLERHGWTDLAITPLERLPEGREPSGMTAPFRDPASEMELLSIMLCARKLAATEPPKATTAEKG